MLAITTIFYFSNAALLRHRDLWVIQENHPPPYCPNQNN